MLVFEQIIQMCSVQWMKTCEVTAKIDPILIDKYAVVFAYGTTKYTAISWKTLEGYRSEIKSEIMICGMHSHSSLILTL